jgi:hypothetical protein
MLEVSDLSSSILSLRYPKMILLKLPQHLITPPHLPVLEAYCLNIALAFALATALAVPFKSSKAEWASRIDSSTPGSFVHVPYLVIIFGINASQFLPFRTETMRQHLEPGAQDFGE